MKNNKMKLLLTGLFMIVITSTEAFGSNLIGHWDFEEGSGETAIDSSGNALTGNIINAVYTVGNVGNYALDFNGADSFVQVGLSPLLNPDSVGISLWFKPSRGQYNSQNQGALLDKGHGYGSNPYFGGYSLQYLAEIAGGNSTVIDLYGNGSDFPRIESGPGYNDDQWHHVVANLGAAEMALYMDGQLIAKTSGQGAIVDNDSPLFFGRHRAVGRYFEGAIDDIRIYDGALSQLDVTQLYQSANPVPLPATLFLFGTGLAGLVGVSLNRAKNRSIEIFQNRLGGFTSPSLFPGGLNLKDITNETYTDDGNGHFIASRKPVGTS